MRSYRLQCRWGALHEQATPEEMHAALQELGTRDPEHPDTWLEDEDGWSVSVSERNAAVFENVETGEGPWHLPSVTREEALQLWAALAEGDLTAVRARPWLEGYPPVSEREQADAIAAAELAQETSDRQFMAALGPEVGSICSEPGCEHRSIRLGVQCRRHHFRMVRGREWPFGGE
jgi:hypothetical protein